MKLVATTSDRNALLSVITAAFVAWVTSSVCFMTTSQAGVISLNFVRNSDGSGEMAPTDVAGVIPVDNWNTATQANSNAEIDGITLVDDAGVPTPATATWQTGAAAWSVATAGAGSPGDMIMMTGYLDQGGNGENQFNTVTVTDIPFSTYDVYLYHSSSGGANRSARYTANGIDLFTRNLDPANTFDGFVFDQHDTIEESNASESGGNYIMWTGLTGDLMIEALGISTSDGGHPNSGETRRSPIQGIQIVDLGLFGDINEDGVVDILDFNIMSGNFGIPDPEFADGDANRDKSIDLIDFRGIKNNFGCTEDGCPEAVQATQAVPEPSTVLMGLLSFLAFAAARRRLTINGRS